MRRIVFTKPPGCVRIYARACANYTLWDLIYAETDKIPQRLLVQDDFGTAVQAAGSRLRAHHAARGRLDYRHRYPHGTKRRLLRARDGRTYRAGARSFRAGLRAHRAVLRLARVAGLRHQPAPRTVPPRQYVLLHRARPLLHNFADYAPHRRRESGAAGRGDVYPPDSPRAVYRRGRNRHGYADRYKAVAHLRRGDAGHRRGAVDYHVALCRNTRPCSPSSTT